MHLRSHLAAAAFMVLATGAAVDADFEVILAKESELPFALSPSRFANSPSKFSNSISKFSNSSSKFSNSSSGFDNSPAKFDNGPNGNRRLLLRRGGELQFVGYYAWGDDGLINFFSPRGDRLFYSPPETDALFDGESGDFAGTMASVDGRDVVLLTEKGQLMLMRAGVSLDYSRAATPERRYVLWFGPGTLDPR